MKWTWRARPSCAARSIMRGSMSPRRRARTARAGSSLTTSARRLEEVVGPLLERDAAEEEHDRLVDRLLLVPLDALLAPRHGVVHDADLALVDAVARLQHARRVVADAHDAVGGVEAGLLDRDDARVGAVAGAVVLAGVDVDDERLAAGALAATPPGKVIQSCAWTTSCGSRRAMSCEHLGVAADLGEEVAAVAAGATLDAERDRAGLLFGLRDVGLGGSGRDHDVSLASRRFAGDGESRGSVGSSRLSRFRRGHRRRERHRPAGRGRLLELANPLAVLLGTDVGRERAVDPEHAQRAEFLVAPSATSKSSTSASLSAPWVVAPAGAVDRGSHVGRRWRAPLDAGARAGLAPTAARAVRRGRGGVRGVSITQPFVPRSFAVRVSSSPKTWGTTNTTSTPWWRSPPTSPKQAVPRPPEMWGGNSQPSMRTFIASRVLGVASGSAPSSATGSRLVARRATERSRPRPRVRATRHRRRVAARARASHPSVRRAWRTRGSAPPCSTTARSRRPVDREDRRRRPPRCGAGRGCGAAARRQWSSSCRRATSAGRRPRARRHAST